MQTATASPPSKNPVAASVLLALASLTPSRTNPRQTFEAAGLKEMAESIKVHGVLQPILVRPLKDKKFEIVAGERRYRASKLADLSDIPAIVRTLNDKQVLEIQVIENLQREDLHPLEEADGYSRLIKAHDYTAQTIADKIGMSKAYVHRRLQLAALSPAARKLFHAEKLTPTTAMLVARIPVPELRDKAAREIASGRYQGSPPMSANEAVRHVRDNYMLALAEAPFPTGDEKLLKGCGSCTACPKRTGNQPELFGDIKGKDVCTDPICFTAKRGAHLDRRTAEAKAKGINVIAGAEAKKIKPYQHGPLQGGWVALSDNCYDDPKSRTYRALLGKSAPKVTLLECPETHKLLEIARATDIADALKAKGVNLVDRSHRTTNRYSAKQKALEARAKLETQVRGRVVDAIKSKVGDLSIPDRLLIALALYEAIGYETQKTVCDRWGWTEQFKKDRKVTTEVTALSTFDLHRFMMDCALAGEVRVSHWEVERSDFKATTIAAIAKRHSIDVDKIRKTVIAEAPVKKGGKAKPVKAKPARKATKK